MLKKYLFLLIILLSAFELSGCATGAEVGPMVANYQTNQMPKKTALLHGIMVGHVAGGQETNPLWASEISNENFKASLEQSLQKAHLYHPLSGASYELNANLISLKKPLIGLNLTVTCEIQYEMFNTKNNSMIFDKTITTAYTAKFSDSPVAIIRLRKANEGAARENIKQLIAALYQLSRK